MLLLLTLAWPWILLGSLLLLVGFISIDLSLREWLRYILSLPFILSADQTEAEKQQTDQPVEEIAASNPGCMLIMAGVTMVCYGICRWIA